MFQNDNPHTNGESWFISFIQNEIDVIFDVGCRSDSLFLNYPKEVHYFDPNIEFLHILKNQPHSNTKAFYNEFGLGDKKDTLKYYKYFQSFIDRRQTCRVDNNTIFFNVDKGVNYLTENNLTNIDFLKIDTEGFEFAVIKGFEQRLTDIKIIQFEYGKTYIDSGVKLVEVANYLREYGFQSFYYLNSSHLVPITDFQDHYKYCNIICFNDRFPELNKWN